MEKQEYENLDGIWNDVSLIDDSFEFQEEYFTDKTRMSDPIFKSIGYPSKIFYENIQKYISGYTKPGGIVLDSCAGSGSTGIAALLEKRKCILMDNSPQASNMEYSIINYVDLDLLDQEYSKMINKLENLINDIYYTKTSEGENGYADVIIASNVYACPTCKKEIVLYKNETGKRSEYKCPHCDRVINISKKEDKEGQIDKRRPVEVTIIALSKTAPKKETRLITEEDKKIWEEKYNYYNNLYGELWSPSEKIIYNRCYPRVGGWPGFDINASVSDLFPKGNLLALKILNNYIETEIADINVGNFFKFIFLETLFRTSSRLFTGSGIKNVYHIPPVGKEQNVLTVFKRKYKGIRKAKAFLQEKLNKEQTEKDIKIIKGNAQQLNIKGESIDYAFIDPPYGGMVPYAELNLFYSAWLNEKEDLDNEIVIPMDFEKKDGYVEKWGGYIEKAFGEVYRVLRPGAHFTVVFHSTFNNIWNELKDVMINRLRFEFVNIVENERGTTFHTNHINDTNPVSALITYRKPLKNEMGKDIEVNSKTIFEIFDKEYLRKAKTFREIQSKIIFTVQEKQIKEVPDDKDIKQWLNEYCSMEGERYILK